MPRLPDIGALGERPMPQPRRQIANYTPVRQPDAGQGIFELGASLADAQKRMQDRKDAVNRVREAGMFAQEVETDLRTFQDSVDVSDPESVKNFGTQVREKLDGYLSNHKGSDESKLRLAERLEGITALYGDKITTISFAAQKALMDRTIGETVSTLAGEAGARPGGVEDYFARLDATVGDLEPALSAQAAEQARLAGRGEIMKSAISGLIERGGHKEARELLASTPNAAAYLSPADQRAINASIIRGEQAEVKARAAAETELASLRVILGREPTPQERARKAGVAPPVTAGKPTLSETIASAEAALGRPLTTQERENAVAQFLKIGGEGGGFGSSIAGRSLDIITNDAPAYAAGLLSPDEERRFLSAVTQYTQPTYAPNPFTGQLEQKTPQLPAFVAQALQQRPPPAGGQPGLVPGGALPTGPQGAPQAGMPGQVPQVVGPNDGRPEQPRTTASAAMGGKTIFDMSADIAGPVPAIGETLSRTPGVGMVVQTPAFIQARRFAELASNDLVRVLQNNPRFAEGERKQIRDELSIDPKFFDTAEAFRNRLMAVDDSLAIRAADAFKTINAPGISLEERRRAIDNLNAINNFRQNLGVPPLVKTPDEARKLPPGTVFRNPAGAIMQVPGG